jgi:hypothetical protein
VRESVKAPGRASLMTLLSDTAYHSFIGEVEARTPPRYVALPGHAVTNFWHSSRRHRADRDRLVLESGMP